MNNRITEHCIVTMNKSNVINLLAALMFATCTSTPKSYVIEGVIPDASYNNWGVYMFDFENQYPVDSALVVNGKFTFTGSVDTAVLRRLVLGHHSVIVILESGKISVNLTAPESLKGTPLNDELTKFWADSEAYESFFETNKNNPVGAIVLFFWSNYLTPDEFDLQYSRSGEIVQKFKPLQKIIDTNARIRQTAEGKPFTDFTIENGNMDGSKVSLSDYVGKGKYVLADFWASWCWPCIAEIPVLVEVYNKHKGEKFEMLGIAVWDKREDTMKSIESHNTTWPQILETGEIATNLYGINMIPHIILFGPGGTIVARGLRGDVLKAKVEEVMCDCNW